MGNACSPNYANLFMGKFEEDFVYNNPFSPFLKCWYRYIDDIFFIFSGTVAQLDDFKMYIDSRMLTIKFTIEFSSDSVSFLDVNVRKDDLFSKSVYRKNTGTNSYLHFASYHPPGLKKKVFPSVSF